MQVLKKRSELNKPSYELGFEEVVCFFALMVLSGSVFLQVIMRFLFSSALVWAEETAVYGMILAVYMGAVMGIRDRAHIRITIIINKMPRSIQIVSIVLADILWFFFISFLLYQSIILLDLLFEVTYITIGLGIEQRWVQLIIPFTLVLMLFRMVQVYYRWGKNKWKNLPI